MHNVNVGAVLVHCLNLQTSPFFVLFKQDICYSSTAVGDKNDRWELPKYGVKSYELGRTELACLQCQGQEIDCFGQDGFRPVSTEMQRGSVASQTPERLVISS